MLRYLIRLDNVKKCRPHQIREISIGFSKTAERFDTSLKNFRISEVAIEFDLFVKDVGSKKQAVEALVSEHGSLLSERNLSKELVEVQDKQATVKLVIELFNEQRYWDCHEAMEGIWRKEKDPVEKDLQQGVILAASALVHAQKSEEDVCFGMLPRTLEKLSSFEKQYYLGLNVDLLKNHLQEMLETRRILFRRI
ncbi:MAG: DUF309 domain-containing protein [Nitrososphaerales archaeon]